MKARAGQSVVVVGGGVIGAMCAWELRSAGLDVTVVDRDRFGAGCSHGNCGYVSPSHVLPLCRPGAIRSTLPALLGRNSPLSIRPRWAPDLWWWLWNFTLRCNRHDMLETAQALHELLQSSKRLYQQLIAEQSLDCQWQERGLIFVFESPRHFEAFEATNRLLSEQFDLVAVPHAGDAVRQLEPALKPGLAGGWFYDCDCHLRPDRLMIAMRKLLEQSGVRIIESIPIDRILSESGRARAVQGQGQTLEADSFLFATGAWTPFLNDALGCRIPIQPGKGYSLTMPCPDPMPRIPLIFEQHRVAITPMVDRYRIGSTMEFAGYDSKIHRRRLELLRTSAERYLRQAHCEPIEEEWYGWRPMTWDGKPVIDRSPIMNNVWIAAGHNMLGISLATGTARLVRERMLAETPHVDPHHFRLARFSRRR